MFKKHQLDHQRKKNMSSKKNKMNFPESRTPFVNSKRLFKRNLKRIQVWIFLGNYNIYIYNYFHISQAFLSQFTVSFVLKGIGTTGSNFIPSPEKFVSPKPVRPPGDATLSAHPNNFVVSGFAVPKSK